MQHSTTKFIDGINSKTDKIIEDIIKIKYRFVKIIERGWIEKIDQS